MCVCVCTLVQHYSMCFLVALMKCIHTYVCMYTYAYLHMYVHTCVHTYVRILYTSTYIYKTHTHIKRVRMLMEGHAYVVFTYSQIWIVYAYMTSTSG